MKRLLLMLVFVSWAALPVAAIAKCGKVHAHGEGTQHEGHATKATTATPATAATPATPAISAAGAKSEEVCHLKINQMTCGICAAEVKKNIKDITLAAQIDWKEGHGEAKIDPSKTTCQQVCDKVTGTGFPCSVQ